MKKNLIIFIIIMSFMFFGCAGSKPRAIRKVETGIATYYELEDGTWMSDDIIYKYKLEISGRMPSAAVDSTYVYLSNIADIPFEKAWKAAGFSSSTDDYFSKEEAILIDMRVS